MGFRVVAYIWLVGSERMNMKKENYYRVYSLGLRV